MIKKYGLKILLIVACLVGSVIGGWYLMCLFTLLPLEMPLSVDAFIRFVLSVSGNDNLANADDMEMLALLLYWTIATFLTAVVLIGFERWVSRSLIARKSASAIPKLPLPVTLATSLIAFLVISYLGWNLTSPLTRYPFHIPLPVKAIIRFCLSVTGQSARSEQDLDMLLYAMDLYWAVATVAIGVPVILCCLAIRRFVRKKNYGRRAPADS
ncbi:hypothetical protein B0G71_5099 [Paraburkholderia sp. BL27I4N3]|uniref:hypothetical protein n=1 Tax=Paraburkholderia sp. BL27I4N3 TaxID=1938805 RepID=UPI000E23AA81|nr:hypothetical protein [Paraburkholderia sp. BL27I4N3]REE21906.1 hypothetical protein B0G71_5099 [Paraburkholderia sp. BL27I4N3]